MENFVKLLKKTIDAQADITPQLRQLIYARARKTIEKKLSQANAPETIAAQQKDLLEKAIAEVEASYQSTSSSSSSTSQDLDASTISQAQNASQATTPVAKNYNDQHVEAQETQTPLPSEIVGNIAKSNDDKNKQKDDLGFERLGDILKPQSERKALAAAKRKRWIFSIIVLLLILLIGSIAYWILKPFEKKVEEVVNTPTTENSSAPQNEKISYRLNPDGTETLASPINPQEENTSGKSTSEATPQNIAKADLALATLYLTQTEDQTEKIQTGDVEWVEARDISDTGVDLGPIIRGNISIPVDAEGQKFIALMTIHPNRDETIPATYITDLIFVTPDGYKEGPVEKILDLRFKPTEQIQGQQLAGVTYETIGDNFFLLPMSSAGPFADNNLRLMREMPWIRIVAQLKNGRIMELTFKKGEKGTEVFDNVIGEWLGEKNSSTTPAPTQNITTPTTTEPNTN